MIAKVGKVLFSKERLPKFKKISNLTFIIGLIMLIIYPFLSDNIFIVEKQLKFSDGFNVNLNKNIFNQNSKQLYKRSKEWWNEKKLRLNQENENILENTNKNLYIKFLNELFLKNLKRHILIFEKTIKIKTNNIDNHQKFLGLRINSQRGDFSKAIILNFIYDENKNPNENCFHFFFGFIKNFEEKNFYNWLAKDLIVNLIPKDLFYNNFNEFFEIIKNDFYFNSIFHEYFINIDMSNINFEYSNSFQDFKLIFKINGLHSENVDMDYYKVFFDNFNKINSAYGSSLKFIIKNFEKEYSYFSSNDYKNTINFIKSKFSNLLSSFIDSKYIKSNIVFRRLDEFYEFFIQNIFENYLFINRKINLNDLLISHGKTSILVKFVKDNTVNENQKYLLSDNELENAQKIFEVFERIIKNLSKCEIDIFRGDKNYILSYNDKFQGTGLFILIPILCVLRIFYEILEKIYSIDEMENLLGEIKDITEENKNIIKSMIFNDKLHFYSIFQTVSIFSGISFFFLGEFLQILNGDILNQKILVPLFSFIDNFLKLKMNKDEKVITIFICFFIFFNLIYKSLIFYNDKAFTKKLNSSSLLDDHKNKFLQIRKKINENFSTIILLFYMGLNLFLIFFLNYAFSFLYLIFVMTPQFILINLDKIFENIIDSKDSKNAKKIFKLKILQKLIDIIVTFYIIFIIMNSIDNNLLIKYFSEIILNKFNNFSIIKFIYLDILIYFSLKIQKLLNF